METKGKIEVAFKYVDEDGEVTIVKREVPPDYLEMSEGDILCELFRDFMVACGFSYLAGKKIVFEDDEM